MARPWLALLGGVAAVAILIRLIAPSLTKSDIPVVDVSPEKLKAKYEAESIGLCPWRSPETDMKAFFPQATAHKEETLLLSGFRLEIGRRLGRTPSAEENAMQIHRLYAAEKQVGTVIARRVRGESGVLELVVATDETGKIVAAKIQRQREPEEIASALRSASFLGAFRGKTADSDWSLDKSFPAVPKAAQPSASALLDGAHTALVLQDVGLHLGAGSRSHSHPSVRL